MAVQEDAEAERLVFELQQKGYTVLTVLEHTTTQRLSTVRLLPPQSAEEGIVVDLLFASSGIEPEVVAQAIPEEVFGGLIVPVARAGHLLAMKLLSHDAVRRPQDGMDIRGLLEELTDGERQCCLEALALITQRGCQRGRDLYAELAFFEG